MALRLEGTDKWALIIALFLVLGGIIGFGVQDGFVIPHAAWDDQPGAARPKTEREYVTPTKARFYSIASIVAGVPLGGYVLWAARGSDATRNV
jgi:hypothetical protein